MLSNPNPHPNLMLSNPNPNPNPNPYLMSRAGAAVDRPLGVAEGDPRPMEEEEEAHQILIWMLLLLAVVVVGQRCRPVLQTQVRQ